MSEMEILLVPWGMIWSRISSRISKIPRMLFSDVAFSDVINSRQQAIAIWGIIVLLVFVCRPESRESIGAFIKAAANIGKQPVFKVLILYQVVFIGLLLCLNLPSINIVVLKDYVMIFLFTLVPFLTKVNLLSFRRALLESICLSAVYQFLVSAYPFNIWIELILMPILLVLSIVNIQVKEEGGTDIFKVVNGLLGIIGFGLLINVGIHFLHDIWTRSLNLNFLEGYLIEPITWLVNLPLIVLAVPLMQFDRLDNFRTSKKTALHVLGQSLCFLFLREWHRWILSGHLHAQVEAVHFSGFGKWRIEVTIKAGTDLKQVNRIQQMYQWMLAHESDYRDHVRIIPSRVECRMNGSTALAIPAYEIKNFKEEYKLERYGI